MIKNLLKYLSVSLCVYIFFFFVTPAKAIELFYPRNNVFVSNNPISFSWEKSPSDVQSYKLTISENADLSAPLLDIVVGSATQSISIPVVSGTTYYWKVFDRKLGMPSGINSFTYIIPDSIGQIVAWYKPESGYVTSGSKVSRWKDVISSANDMLQSNPSLQPTLVNQEPLLNNYSTILFSGNPSNYLQSTSSVSLTNFSIFCLRTYEDYDVPLQYFLGENSQGLFSEGDAISSGFGSYSANGGLIYTPVNTLTNQFAVYLHSNKTLKINNTNPQILSNTPLGNFVFNTLGARADVTSFSFKGKISELLVYNSELSNDKNQLAYYYMADKYAPPVNLGGDTILGTSFCDSVTISAGNRFLNYLWNNGKTTSSIRVLPNGKYTVTVKDVFGRTSTDDINVFPYRRLGNKTIYLCAGQTYNLDLKTPAGFTALWNTGATTTTLNITTAGQYTVTITDTRGCSVNDTINVIVDNPRLSITPVSNNINACLGEKLFVLTETAFDSIRWSTGSTNSFIQLTAPGSYSVNASTIIGCVLNKTFNVTIIGSAPTAKFGYSATCKDLAVNFSDSSSAPSGNTIQNWKWTFSNGTTSTAQNPSTTFQNLGAASASLKVTTNTGCSDSIFKPFVINKKPIPSFYYLLSCSGIPTTFVDQTTPNAAAVTDWAWNFGGLGVSNGIQNPAFEFPAAGIYNVNLKATNSNGCYDTVTLQTTVNVSPVSNFSYDSACGKTPVNLKFLASVVPPSTIPVWNWDFGDGTFESAIKDPQHQYATPGIYDVKLIVRSSDNCVDTAVKQVKVFDFPVVDFAVSQTQCVGKEIQFTDISTTPDGTPITKWNWYFSGLATSQLQNPRYTFNTQGNYTIQLTAKNAVGCSGTKLRSIAISEPPVPKFTFSPNGVPAPLNVTYVNQSATSGSYIWDYGDGSPLIQAYNPPAHLYTVNGSYPIKLIATDFRGCTDTLTKYILVDKAYLDGVMASISIIPDGDFYKIQASVINNSNVEITDLGLSLQLGGGSVIRENWSGSLMPRQTVVYLFTGEIKVGENSQIPVVCASIDNINNNSREDRLDNNTTCKEVKVGSFDILNIYPNPAYNNINFGIMLPKDGRVNIRFVDIVGQQMYSRDFDGLKGYNSLPMPTDLLNAAVYVAEVSFDGEVVRKKFMRSDRK